MAEMHIYTVNGAACGSKDAIGFTIDPRRCDCSACQEVLLTALKDLTRTVRRAVQEN